MHSRKTKNQFNYFLKSTGLIVLYESEFPAVAMKLKERYSA